MKIVGVIAAYDEVENILPLCRRLVASLRGFRGGDFRLIFVVEGEDGTEQALLGLSAELPEIVVLRPPAARGLGAAFRLGFAAVPRDADVVVTLDADLNHAPEEIPRLVAALEGRRADIVVGSRRVPGARTLGQPRWKRCLSGAANALLRRFFATGIGDQTSGFRAYRAAALRRLDFRNDGFAFLPEMLTLAAADGLVVVEEPIAFVYRRHGRSKLRLLPAARSYLRLLAGGLRRGRAARRRARARRRAGPQPS